MNRLVRQDFANVNPTGFRKLDWMKVQRYSGVIGDFDSFSGQSIRQLLSLVTEYYSCVSFLDYWPVSHWSRAKTRFMTRLSKALRSAVQLLQSLVDQWLKVLLSAAQWARSSKRPDNFEIATSSGGRFCFISPLLWALRLGGRVRFFVVLGKSPGTVLSRIFCLKFLTNRGCFDV